MLLPSVGKALFGERPDFLLVKLPRFRSLGRWFDATWTRLAY